MAIIVVTSFINCSNIFYKKYQSKNEKKKLTGAQAGIRTRDLLHVKPTLYRSAIASIIALGQNWKYFNVICKICKFYIFLKFYMIAKFAKTKIRLKWTEILCRFWFSKVCFWQTLQFFAIQKTSGQGSDIYLVTVKKDAESQTFFFKVS